MAAFLAGALVGRLAGGAWGAAGRPSPEVEQPAPQAMPWATPQPVPQPTSGPQVSALPVPRIVTGVSGTGPVPIVYANGGLVGAQGHIPVLRAQVYHLNEDLQGAALPGNGELLGMGGGQDHMLMLPPTGWPSQFVPARGQ